MNRLQDDVAYKPEVIVEGYYCDRKALVYAVREVWELEKVQYS